MNCNFTARATPDRLAGNEDCRFVQVCLGYLSECLSFEKTYLTNKMLENPGMLWSSGDALKSCDALLRDCYTSQNMSIPGEYQILHNVRLERIIRDQETVWMIILIVSAIFLVIALFLTILHIGKVRFRIMKVPRIGKTYRNQDGSKLSQRTKECFAANNFKWPECEAAPQ